MPSGARIIINDGERILEAEEGRPLLFTAMSHKVFIPSACGGRASCGQCRIRVQSGAAEHVPEETAILSADEMARGVHLACQLKVSQETRIDLPPGYLKARQYLTTVARIRDLARDMREVELDLLEPSRMEFLAGQYVQFLRPGSENDARPLYRAYSMASPPSSFTRLSLLFARVPEGECTSYVFERLRQGQRVTINGPFGSFHLRESARQIILVAGGSGIAPIRAILADMQEKAIPRHASFFFSAHSAADLVYIWKKCAPLSRTCRDSDLSRCSRVRSPPTVGKERKAGSLRRSNGCSLTWAITKRTSAAALASSMHRSTR
jgi:Na+-transporting NADH:ubiquinone oxidoreductase subunit F